MYFDFCPLKTVSCWTNNSTELTIFFGTTLVTVQVSICKCGPGSSAGAQPLASRHGRLHFLLENDTLSDVVWLRKNSSCMKILDFCIRALLLSLSCFQDYFIPQFCRSMFSKPVQLAPKQSKWVKSADG